MTVAPANKNSQVSQRSQEPRTLKDYLARPDIQKSIAAVIPKHLTPEKLMKTALVAVSRVPQLSECTIDSLLKSLMVSAELGLNPSGALGEGYLVPFKRNFKKPDGGWSSTMEAQFIPGYRGLIALARRSGNIQSIEAHVVYASDRFELEFGLTPRLVHVPDVSANDLEDGNITGAYCIARFKDGGAHAEYMTRGQIDAIRKRSKASNGGPWVTDYAEMCRKTVVRRAAKYWPLSTEDLIARAIESEDRAETGVSTADLLPTDMPQLANEAAQLARDVEQPTRAEQIANRLAPASDEQPSIDMTTGEARDVVGVQIPDDQDAQDAPPTQQPAPTPAGTAPSKSEQLIVLMTDVYGNTAKEAADRLEAFCQHIFHKDLASSAAKDLTFNALKAYITKKEIK